MMARKHPKRKHKPVAIDASGNVVASKAEQRLIQAQNAIAGKTIAAVTTGLPTDTRKLLAILADDAGILDGVGKIKVP